MVSRHATGIPAIASPLHEIRRGSRREHQAGLCYSHVSLLEFTHSINRCCSKGGGSHWMKQNPGLQQPIQRLKPSLACAGSVIQVTQVLPLAGHPTSGFSLLELAYRLCLQQGGTEGWVRPCGFIGAACHKGRTRGITPQPLSSLRCPQTVCRHQKKGKQGIHQPSSLAAPEKKHFDLRGPLCH